MMIESEFNIRTAQSTDRSRLANLIHFGTHIHQHLDWKAPLDWIGSSPYLLLENQSEVLATLACPPELPDISWIRLFASGSLITAGKAWDILWNATINELLALGNIKVAAISLQSWFNDLLSQSGFSYIDNVVVLMWERSTPIPASNKKHFHFRPMLPEDLEIVTKIDQSAFDLIWKNSQESLELAFQQASLSSVVETDDGIIGYQFSTMSAMGGHLARLAVMPDWQGRGIGYLLVHEVLKQFYNLGATHVTVNTQKNNNASLALYAKAGFSLTGESYRVYLNNLTS
jgi:ribosomal-protein-alanine N-acetyltransferase